MKHFLRGFAVGAVSVVLGLLVGYAAYVVGDGLNVPFLAFGNGYAALLTGSFAAAWLGTREGQRWMKEGRA